MNTVNQLQERIDALRTLTERNAITPELLGTLLHDITEHLNGMTTETVTSGHILCDVVNGVLYVRGAQRFLEAGYVPYLFRFSRKNTQQNGNKRAFKHKGWNQFGSRHSLCIKSDDHVLFSKNVHMRYHEEADGYDVACNNLIIVKNTTMNFGMGSEEVPHVVFGRRAISLLDRRDYRTSRMIRLPFGIAFASPIDPGRKRITAADLVSNLATFSVNYHPGDETWCFSK
jgi:hypothetical protein